MSKRITIKIETDNGVLEATIPLPESQADTVLTLLDRGEKWIGAIKVVRQYAGLPLKEAKELTERATPTSAGKRPSFKPSDLVSGQSIENFKRDLEENGAKVEMTYNLQSNALAATKDAAHELLDTFINLSQTR